MTFISPTAGQGAECAVPDQRLLHGADVCMLPCAHLPCAVLCVRAADWRALPERALPHPTHLQLRHHSSRHHADLLAVRHDHDGHQVLPQATPGSSTSEPSHPQPIHSGSRVAVTITAPWRETRLTRLVNLATKIMIKFAMSWGGRKGRSWTTWQSHD